MGVVVTMTYARGGTGSTLLYVMMGWGIPITVALLLRQALWLANAKRMGGWQMYLPFLPLLFQGFQDLVVVDLMWRDTISAELFHTVRHTINGGELLLGAFTVWLLSRLRPDTLAFAPSPLPEPDPASALGRGGRVHDRVTRAVIHRARDAGSTSRFSLVMMVCLVLVGGGASVGLWLVDDLERFRTLQIERNKLLQMNAQLQVLTLPASRAQVPPAALDTIRRFIDREYGSPTLEQTIQSVQRQPATDLPNLFNRLTIAVLTLFLVQVFFAVHRYSRQLAAALSAKAEALELIGESDDALALLRTEVIGAVNHEGPAFGASPKTPVQDALAAASALSK